MEMAGVFPDLVIGCVGGGSNFAGLAFPFLREKIAGRDIDVLACEPAACPTLTRGLFVVGSAFRPEWLFAHAQHDAAEEDRFTTVFEDFVPVPEVKQLLLDHILLSPGLAGGGGLRAVPGSGAVRHAEYLAQVVNGGARRQDRPSDHRPVSVELEF